MGSYWKTALHYVAAGAIAAVVSFGVASYYKPAPVFYKPQTNVSVARPIVPGPLTGNQVVALADKSDRRRIDRTWSELDQKEVDELTALLNKIDKVEVVIYCAEDTLCGDLQLNFDNAFESAHWTTRLEKPLLDGGVTGIATSSNVLKEAIDQATHKRLNVKIIDVARSVSVPPYEVLVIGQKPRE